MSEFLMPEKMVNLSVDTLVPYEKNSRLHPEEQLKQIMASIGKYGFLVPVLIDENKMILAGHGRVEAAKRLGMDKVPCVSSKHLSDEQKRAFIIADNKIAENAEWDENILALELADLHSLDFDLAEVGFDDKELNKLLYEGNDDPEDEDQEGDENAAPELAEHHISKPGDVWVMGQHRLMCGDSTVPESLEILVADTPAHLIFTDPPYGVSYDASTRSSPKKAQRKKSHKMIEGDALEGRKLISLIRDSLRAGLFVCKEDAPTYVCFTWGTWREFEAGLEEAGLGRDNCIIWRKNTIGLGNSKYRPQHEFIFFTGRNGPWYGNKAQSDVWDFKRDATGGYVHPTQKPVKLVEKAIINSSKRGDVVLDLFGGSGTTLIACEKRNRAARLMELDPQYCDVIIKRWQEYTGGQAVHAETGKPFGK